MSNKVSLNRRWVSWAIKALVLMALVGAAVYWVKFSPVAVQQHEVERGELREELMGTGRPASTTSR